MKNPPPNSIIIGHYPYIPQQCKLPLGDSRYLLFSEKDAHLAIQTWHAFQIEKQANGLDSAFDKVVEWLDLKPAQG